AGRGTGPLCETFRPRRVATRLLRGLRVLEAGLHPRRGVLPVLGRRRRRRQGRVRAVRRPGEPAGRGVQAGGGAPLMWRHVFSLGHVTVAEKIVRALLVYVYLVIALRLAGKRELAQL